MADKQAYVSPPEGALDITVIRDANPRVQLTLDLGIPNFTVFSMTIPLVEDEPKAMSGLIAEAVHVLLDEVSNFMMSAEYDKEVMVLMYATVLAAFKGMSNEADSSKEQDAIGADHTVKTFEGTFVLPMPFVNETQKKVVTAAALGLKNSERLYEKIKKFTFNPKRSQLFHAYEQNRSDQTSKALSDFQHKGINELFSQIAEYFNADSLFEEESSEGQDKFAWAGKNLEMAQHAREKKMYEVAVMGETTALAAMSQAVGYVRNTLKFEQGMTDFRRHVEGATKIQRAPKVRHIEFTYSPKQKNTVQDAARVIRQYRNRSLKQQSKPLYVIVYDQQGRPTGTVAVGPQFKNTLLKNMKKGSVDFSSPVSFNGEEALKSTALKGIPKVVSVGGVTYTPEAVAGVDMALYRGPQDWLVKFTDGRTSIFPGRPTFRNMRRLNFPVPKNRFKWTMIPQEEVQPVEEKLAPASIEPVEAPPDANAGGII